MKYIYVLNLNLQLNLKKNSDDKLKEIQQRTLKYAIPKRKEEKKFY